MDAASNNSVEDIRSIREEVNFLPTKAKYRVYIIDEVHMLSTGAFNALEIVCKETNIEATKGALAIIASLAEGAMRDALSILERCIQDGENKIDEDKIKELVGIPKVTFVNGIIGALLEYDVDKALEKLNEILQQGCRYSIRKNGKLIKRRKRRKPIYLGNDKIRKRHFNLPSN